MTTDGQSHYSRPRTIIASLAAGLAALLFAPSLAAATVTTETHRVGPVQVDGYEVLQSQSLAPTPKANGFITRMEVDLVDEQGQPVPIQRLMLHHIVFANLARQDKTCTDYIGFDGLPGFSSGMPQRFYGAGEERARLALPPGYGYPTKSTDPWGLVYMVMNHLPSTDQAYIQYTVTIDDDPSLEAVDPYWLDVENCKADPIYNVPGTGEKGSTHTKSADFTFPEAGRIVAGGGHVHGGARRLTLSQPACDGREISRSVPTWGSTDHPFYNVKPILHEPGPINMSGFGTAQGIPVASGETIRLDAEYENSRPHTRVMGIDVVYFAPDAGVTERCGPLPTDTVTVGTSEPGKHAPVPFTVPLTGLDEDGNAIKINAPPGKLRRMRSGGTVSVGDHFFSEPNLEIEKGAEIEWEFNGSELHNLTLANGPVGIGSANLNDGRVYSRKFTKPGTYRLFCALHPVQMSERVVVEKNK